MARLSSMVCRTSHFYSEWYGRNAHHLHTGEPLQQWKRIGIIQQLLDNYSNNPPIFHRKMWEWAAIAEVLRQRGMLRPGRHGIGFAVGQEPITSYFAACGVKVLATDLDTSKEGDSHWAASNQQSVALEQVRTPRLVDATTFAENVTFQEVDMRKLEGLTPGSADFLWSSCSFEHLGSIEAGLNFVERAMDFLKPGGVAVHTTEFNCLSNEKTLEEGWAVIYRKRDLENLKARLALQGATLEPVDYRIGRRKPDYTPEPPPWSGGQSHVKLLLEGFVATSVLLVITKGAEAAIA